jgi:hypothetical protein
VQKTTSNIFLKNKRKFSMLDRSIPTREALVHSIPISEVKDMKSDVFRALKGSFSEKKTLNLIFFFLERAVCIKKKTERTTINPGPKTGPAGGQ